MQVTLFPVPGTVPGTQQVLNKYLLNDNIYMKMSHQGACASQGWLHTITANFKPGTMYIAGFVLG